MSWKRQHNDKDGESIERKTRHRVYCPECNKPKLLFETKEKALNFIKFNGDEIERTKGYRPIRAYKCGVCDGWHVTSHMRHVKNWYYKTISDTNQKVLKIIGMEEGRYTCVMSSNKKLYKEKNLPYFVLSNSTVMKPISKEEYAVAINGFIQETENTINALKDLIDEDPIQQ